MTLVTNTRTHAAFQKVPGYCKEMLQERLIIFMLFCSKFIGVLCANNFFTVKRFDVPELKPTCPRKTKNRWSPWSQSGGWKGRRTMEERICGKDEFSAWSGREKE